MMVMIILRMETMNYRHENTICYDEWERLARCEYHGVKDGYWICYYDNGNLIYIYIKYNKNEKL